MLRDTGHNAFLLESLSSPDRGGFQAVMSFLNERKEQRMREKKRMQEVEHLPCRVTGEQLRKLEDEFGVKLKVIDRGPSAASYATAKHHLISVKNRRIKSWDGEEVIEFDRELMPMAVKNEGWVHCCRTARNAEVCADYERQEYGLLKAVEGRRSDIRVAASELMRQVRSGGGARVCMDASMCTHAADTLLVDLTRVDVAAPQLGAAMAQHQASRAKVFFYFEPDMFVSDDGDLTSTPGRYLIDRASDLVHIFPDRNSHVHYSYHYSTMISYLCRADVTCGGERYSIEVHDSQPGVVYVQMTLNRYEAEFDTEVETRFYRTMTEAMTVVEQYMVLSGSREPLFVRDVFSTRLFERLELRMDSFPLEKITLENARTAVRDFTGQESIRSTIVMMPERYPVGFHERVATAIYRRALYRRAELEIEQRELAKQTYARDSSVGALVTAVVGLVCDTGRNVLDAIVALAKELACGYVVSADYTVKAFPLEFGYIVRDIVSAKTSRDFAYRVVSYMPEPGDVDGSAYGSSLTQEVLSRARAVEANERLEEADEIFFECEQVVENLDQRRQVPVAAQRKELVEKMVDAYDAHVSILGPRQVVEGSAISMPECTPEAVVSDPCGAINEQYARLFPALEGIDLSGRSHMLSAEDHYVSLRAPYAVMNEGYDQIAKPMSVRKSSIMTAGGGRRPLTQFEGVLAFSKRVANAPRAHQDRNYDEMMDRHFARFSRVCLVADWQERVKARVESGMWTARLSELEKNVAKLDTGKVTTMLREMFILGQTDLTQWKAMVKTIAKPQMSEAAAYEHKAGQTIIYQESKMANSLFSSMTSEFHDTLDEVLCPNVRINVRRDVSDAERWFNTWQLRRISAGSALRVFESDISQCDKSHNLYNLMAYMHFLRKFGAPEELCDLWSVLYGKKTASSSMIAFMIEIVEQLLSGAWWTISVNSIVCALGVVNSYELEASSVISLQVTGDDTLLELVKEVDLQQVSDRMRDDYNFEVKSHRVKVPYFCSRYYIYFDGYWFIVKDPIKVAENLGRYISATADISELHISYCDEMRHYGKSEIMDILSMCTVERHGFTESPRALLRGLSSLLTWKCFEDVYGNVVEVVA